MKRILSKAMAAIGVAVCLFSSATVNAADMPEFYLRGDFNNTGWQPVEKYRFTRNGNDYTFVIDNTNAIGDCQFKIGTAEWGEYNLGASLTINSSQYAHSYFNGENYKTSGLNDCVISFTYEPEALECEVKFVVNGVEPSRESDDKATPVYLRGPFSGPQWNVNDLYKFTFSNNEYSLEITENNPVPEGSEFKISSEDWIAVDLGGESRGMEIDKTGTYSLVYNGENLKTVNGIYKGRISFTAGSNDVYFYIDGSDERPVQGLSGTLPVLYINVYSDENHTAYNNEVISKDLNHKNYFDFAEYWLDVNGCQWLKDLGAENVGSAEKPLALQIKARGNWTMKGFSKKPFKLKLDKKQSLLGLSKSKHFAILAHADDNAGYLRNFTGFNLGRRIGLPWTPSQQPVEVVINGNYRGLYFLTESIRVDENRVNIVELKDNEEESKLLSGGYIVELDNYNEDDSAQIRMEEKSCVYDQYLDLLRITFDTPEVYSTLQRDFITQQFTAMNDRVGRNDDSLWSYLDLDDAARYYLVEEIVSHTESYHGSTYLFRDYGDGQKWHFSPLWDFGNAFNGHTDNFFYNCDPFGNTWIPSMRQNAKFNAKVRETWLWFMANEYAGLEQDINEYVDHIVAAAKADYTKWNGQPFPTGGQPVADNRDMQSRKNFVLDHLNSKISWLKGQFGDYTRGTYSEPARDTTPAAELPSFVATGVSVIETDGIDSEAQYYNLQGFEVRNPVPGVIYIVVKGTNAYKTIIR